MFFGDKELIFDKPVIMGIINLTAYSFSDGGKFLKKNSDRDIDKNKVQKELEVLENNGASFIDIGAESTRPGHTVISTQQEIDRLMPILEIVSKSNFDHVRKEDLNSLLNEFKFKYIQEAPIYSALKVNG